MSAAAPLHLKLPGGGVTWSGRGSLWLGEDHLLEVNSLLIVERYRRFFFHETKAFMVQRSKARFIWAMVQTGVGGIFAIVAALIAWPGASTAGDDWHVLFYVMAGIFGALALVCFVLLAINLALGPSCRCYVLTSTGWHALSAPARLGPAEQVQARVFPIIEAAQAPSPATEATATHPAF